MNGINCQFQLLISRLYNNSPQKNKKRRRGVAKKQKKEERSGKKTKKGGVIGEKKIVKDNFSVRIRAAVWVYIFENILNNSKFKMQKSSY